MHSIKRPFSWCLCRRFSWWQQLEADQLSGTRPLALVQYQHAARLLSGFCWLGPPTPSFGARLFPRCAGAELASVLAAPTARTRSSGHARGPSGHARGGGPSGDCEQPRRPRAVNSTPTQLQSIQSRPTRRRRRGSSLPLATTTPTASHHRCHRYRHRRCHRYSHRHRHHSHRHPPSPPQRSDGRTLSSAPGGVQLNAISAHFPPSTSSMPAFAPGPPVQCL